MSHVDNLLDPTNFTTKANTVAVRPRHSYYSGYCNYQSDYIADKIYPRKIPKSSAVMGMDTISLTPCLIL